MKRNKAIQLRKTTMYLRYYSTPSGLHTNTLGVVHEMVPNIRKM